MAFALSIQLGTVCLCLTAGVLKTYNDLIMFVFRKISFFACVLLMVLCSCNSSKHASQKRRKKAPCDCPKFNFVPQNGDIYKAYAFNMMNGANIVDIKDIAKV